MRMACLAVMGLLVAGCTIASAAPEPVTRCGLRPAWRVRPETCPAGEERLVARIQASPRTPSFVPYGGFVTFHLLQHGVEIAAPQRNPSHISTPLREWLLCEAREERIRAVEVAFCAPREAVEIQIEAKLRMHDAHYTDQHYWEMRLGTESDNVSLEEARHLIRIYGPEGHVRP